MKKCAANLILLGGLFVLLVVVLPCSYVQAASDMPEYEIVDSTWDTITIKLLVNLDYLFRSSYMSV